MTKTTASSRREFAPSVADDASQWRRTTPLPAREQASAPAARRQGSYNDAGAGGGADRDWGAARGARFTPAPPAPSSGGMRRDSSGPGREREPMMPSHADEANQWRSAKPMAEIRREAPPHQAAGPTSPSMADTEQTVSGFVYLGDCTRGISRDYRLYSAERCPGHFR